MTALRQLPHRRHCRGDGRAVSGVRAGHADSLGEFESDPYQGYRTDIGRLKGDFSHFFNETVYRLLY